jgi:hypothetical protein
LCVFLPWLALRVAWVFGIGVYYAHQTLFNNLNKENDMKYRTASLVCLFLHSLFAVNAAYAASYADDRAAIVDLQGRYLFAMDFQDAATYASTFAEDGVINWAQGEIKGRKAIYEFMASGTYNPTRNAENGKWPAASRHFITNQVIKVEGNRARAFTYWFQATNNTADRRTMVLGLFGHYEDELVKIKGQWYFKSRTIYNEGLEGRHKAGENNPAR